MSEGKLLIFSGNAHLDLAHKIADFCGLSLGTAKIQQFPDGETDINVQEDVRGADVFIIQPTCPPVNHNLMELLILIDCIRRASAKRITAVIPYFGYARQDRKDTSRVPITAKLVANILTQAGANRILTIDLHAAQIQGFFDIPVDHLYAKPILCRYIKSLNLENFVVVAPDMGSLKMVRAYSKHLDCPFAIVDKRRIDANQVTMTNVIGEIKDKNVILVDDMISTGSTMVEAARLCKERGGANVYLAATHGLFCGNAYDKMNVEEISHIIYTDSIPPNWERVNQTLKEKAVILSIAELLAKAILNIHDSRSVSSLFI